MTRISLALLTLLALTASPAFAGGSHLVRYYIGMDPGTKKCSVVQTRPDGKTMMEATKHWYRSEGTANTAMMAMETCK